MIKITGEERKDMFYSDLMILLAKHQAEISAENGEIKADLLPYYDGEKDWEYVIVNLGKYIDSCGKL